MSGLTYLPNARVLRFPVCCIALVLLGGASVQAQDSAAGAAADNGLYAVYPTAALVTRRSGTVTLACAVKEHSALDSCSLTSEEPKGMGFGAAALALARHFPPEPTTFTPSPHEVATVRFAWPRTITVDAGGITHTLNPPNFAEIPSSEREAEASARYTARLTRPALALLHCDVTIEGRLDPCDVAQESPPGLGAGRAALAIAGVLKMRPLTFDGKPVGGGRIDIPIQLSPPQR